MPTSDLPSARDFSLHPDQSEARCAAERLFERIEAELRALLPKTSDIRHIGATAVPGCLTKGDLDIVVRVPAVDFTGADQALASKFQRNLGSKRTATFAAFEDETSAPHLGIQLTIVGSDDDCFHRFADALNDDSSLLEEYNDLKRRFDGHPMDVYRAAKSDFIAKVLAQTQ
jgi:GrpB-like predicted nucleotidyltransferase (UPF0157 family)